MQNEAYESVVQQILVSKVCNNWNVKSPVCSLRSVDLLQPANGVFSPRCVTWIHSSVDRAHIETRAGAGAGRAGQGDAARETLRDTV